MWFFVTFLRFFIYIGKGTSFKKAAESALTTTTKTRNESPYLKLRELLKKPEGTPLTRTDDRIVDKQCAI
jgi:hypothetical protein